MLIILFLVLHFNFLFVPCGRLSWLPVSFLLHVKHTLSYRIGLMRSCPLPRTFLSRVRTLTRDIDTAILSVCLSVRDVPGSDENDYYGHSFSTYGSSIILVLSASNIFTKSRRGAKYRWVIKISRFSTNKLL